jgi:outer membrane receptor protein involved in Fe transport
MEPALVAAGRAAPQRRAIRIDDRYIVGANPDDSGHRRYQATTPVAGVSFEASPQWRLHAAVGRGFETPTFNELGYRADGSRAGTGSGRRAQPLHRGWQQVARTG